MSGYTLIGFLDRWGHRLHLPGFLMRPICDLYDMSLGVPFTTKNFGPKTCQLTVRVGNHLKWPSSTRDNG